MPGASQPLLLVPQSLLAGPPSRQLGLGMGRECLGEGAWAAELVWWRGGSRCRIMGPPGAAQGAGAAMEGVRFSLYIQLWWPQSRRGIPVNPWATLAHAQRSSRCLGSGTQPSPSSGFQQPPGCHDNQHFHPCLFVWSRSSFCEQAIIRGMEKGPCLGTDIQLGWGCEPWQRGLEGR